MGAIIGIMAIETLIEAGIIYSFMGLLDQALAEVNADNLNMLIAILLVSTIGVKLIALLRTHAYAKVMASISREMRMMLFKRLELMDGSDTLGKIMTYFSEDINGIEDITQVAVPVIITSLLGIVVSLCMLGTISLPLTLLALLGLTLCVLSPLVVRKRVERLIRQGKFEKEHLMHQVSERLHGHREIIANSLEEKMTALFDASTAQLKNTGRQAYFASEVMEVLPKMMVELMNVLIVVAGVQMVFKGVVTAGALLAFNSLYGILSSAVASLTWALPLLNASMVSLNRLLTYLNEGPVGTVTASGSRAALNPAFDAVPNMAAPPLPESATLPANMNIRLDAVTFCYGTQCVLKALSLDIPYGKHVAIVGTSGSGKSTVLHLLMKFGVPQDGAIFIGEQPIEMIETVAYRRAIGLVAQENHLFDMSILENMQLFAPTASMAQVEQALEKVAMLDAVKAMPEGLNTIMRPGHAGLSGGQRQRLAIARILLKNPQMLFLDEATSALDPKTEQQVGRIFDEVFKGRTILNISHRLDQVKHYDLIYVMDQGQVAESGNHESLLHHGGLYAELYRKQSGFDLSNDFSEARISVDRLAEMVFFKPLPSVMLNALMDKFVTEDYHPGEDIIVEGEIGTRFYIVVRGIVQIIKRDAERGEVLVNQLEDGDYFGEIALLSAVARTATVRAKTRCMILSLRRNAFDAILAEAPTLKTEMAETMQLRLNDLMKS
jgi:ATP-binding cassette subfamily B protein